MNKLWLFQTLQCFSGHPVLSPLSSFLVSLRETSSKRTRMIKKRPLMFNDYFSLGEWDERSNGSTSDRRTKQKWSVCLGSETDSRMYICMYRVSINSLYNFENLLQRQIKRQTSGNCYKMRRIYLNFFFSWFNTSLYGYH